MKFVLSVVAGFVAVVSSLNAQLIINNLDTAYTQDFDSLASSGSSNAASGGIFDSGWFFLESGTNANTTYAAGTGSSTTGNTYSFGVAGTNAASDRAFGMLQSGSLNSILGFQFTNQTGQTIDTLTISFTGEEWRRVSSSDTLAFSYQTGTVALNASSGWTPLSDLNFTTPVTGTGLALDGNASSNRTSLSATITGLSIANGSSMTFRWVDATGVSSAGMAIDDFSMIASAPEPSTTGILILGMTVFLGLWWKRGRISVCVHFKAGEA